VRFAHPSERLFAAILDLNGERWEYEPVEFALRWSADGTPVAGFRPDFWLPERGIFIELTTADQRLVTRKNGKVRRMRELYPEVPIFVVYQRDFTALLESHGLRLLTSSAA
jgi:hypoxanthine phosphoribosyltransferase